MAATKSTGTVTAAATALAAAGTVTSTGQSLTTSYGSKITAQITNGATVLTTPANCYLEVSGDNTTYFFDQVQSGGLTASTTYSLSFNVDPAVMFARVRFNGNDQACTVAAQIQTLTAI